MSSVSEDEDGAGVHARPTSKSFGGLPVEDAVDMGVDAEAELDADVVELEVEVGGVTQLNLGLGGGDPDPAPGNSRLGAPSEPEDDELARVETLKLELEADVLGDHDDSGNAMAAARRRLGRFLRFTISFLRCRQTASSVG